MMVKQAEKGRLGRTFLAERTVFVKVGSKRKPALGWVTSVLERLGHEGRVLGNGPREGPWQGLCALCAGERNWNFI